MQFNIRKNTVFNLLTPDFAMLILLVKNGKHKDKCMKTSAYLDYFYCNLIIN